MESAPISNICDVPSRYPSKCDRVCEKEVVYKRVEVWAQCSRRDMREVYLSMFG